MGYIVIMIQVRETENFKKRNNNPSLRRRQIYSKRRYKSGETNCRKHWGGL